MPPPPPPELPDELLGEVFLSLPSDDPACLLRASLACKSWRRILADPAFHRRHRELHRTPSVLGFLCIAEGDAPYASGFVPINTTSGRPAARDLPGRLVLDCRHGRVLFLAPSPSLGTELSSDLFVWNPLTNEERCLPRPSPFLPDVCGRHFNAAVLCSAAAEGCNHSKCHSGPFRVALVWSRRTDDVYSFLTSARLYSSETGNWTEPVSLQHTRFFVLNMMPRPSTLVGDALYFRSGSLHAMEYQLGSQRLSIVYGPRWSAFQGFPMEDGGLGCMGVQKYESRLRLGLWSRKATPRSDGVTRWRRVRVIELEKMLPDGALPSPLPSSAPDFRFPRVRLLGYAEGTDVIFVGIQGHDHPCTVCMVQLNSGRARKVFDKCTFVFPYTSFCIPVTDASSTMEGTGDDASCV